MDETLPDNGEMRVEAGRRKGEEVVWVKKKKRTDDNSCFQKSITQTSISARQLTPSLKLVTSEGWNLFPECLPTLFSLFQLRHFQLCTPYTLTINSYLATGYVICESAALVQRNVQKAALKVT